MLTLVHRQKHQQWKREHQNWSMEQKKKDAWSDESLSFTSRGWLGACTSLTWRRPCGGMHSRKKAGLGHAEISYICAVTKGNQGEPILVPINIYELFVPFGAF